MSEDVSKLVTVSCPDHNEVLVNGLWKFFVNNHRTDSEFQRGGGRSIRAHQLVMEVFLPPEKLPPHSWEQRESLHPTCSQLWSEKHLDSLLEFLYLGRVTVQQERLENLHRLAKEFGFQMLIDAIRSVQLQSDSRADDPGATLPQPQAETMPETEVALKPEMGKKHSGNSIVPEHDNSKAIERGGRVARGKRPLGSRHSTRKTTTPTKYGVVAAAEAKSYSCGHCSSYQSTKYGNYLNHLRSVHQVTVRGKPILKRYKCPECEYSHVFQSALKRHIKIKHDKRFRCGLCHFTTNNQMRLDAHADRTHRPRPEGREESKRTSADGRCKLRRCPHCPYETTKAGSYHSHIRSIHKVTSRGEPVVKAKKFRCDECGHETESRTDLAVHRQSHSASPKENGFPCPLCPFATNDWHKLNVHVNRSHTAALGGAEDSAGEESPVVAQRRSSSADAGADKDEPKLYRCPHCDYQTVKGGNYHNHLRSIHRVTAKGQPAVKKYKCPECNYAHVFQSAIKRHQHVKHSKEKPFNCQQCQFRSTSRGQLNAHVNRVHLGLKKQPPGPRSKHYICDVCARLFTGRDSLKAHCKKFHDADNATVFKCEFCDYTSNSKRDVAVVHRNIFHSGDKRHPYTCVTCGHRSPTRYDLERHRLTHTGERPYKCDVCEKAFSQRGHLNVHKRRQHPGDPAQLQQQQQPQFGCDDMQPQFACDVTLSTD